jgi:hypothetical protein
VKPLEPLRPFSSLCCKRDLSWLQSSARPRGVSGRVKAPQLDSVIVVFACQLVRAFMADLPQLFGTVCYLAAARFHAS